MNEDNGRIRLEMTILQQMRDHGHVIRCHPLAFSKQTPTPQKGPNHLLLEGAMGISLIDIGINLGELLTTRNRA